MGVRVAFVGGGMVSDLHQAALASTPEMQLIGVYDIDPSVTEQRAREWGVKGYASLSELLGDDAIDAVYVLTPAETHVRIALECLERGRHVLVEKPVSDDPDEIKRLIAAARRVGRVAMPAHNYAYIPEFRRIVRLARQGSLGTIRGVWVHYALRHPESVAAAYGGVLGEVMIHHSYLTLALLGAPQWLHAGIHPGAWENHPFEDQAWMVWEYSNGTSAHLFATFAADDQSADPWTFIVKVIGTDGCASMTWRGAVFRNLKTSWFAFGLPIYEETYHYETRAFFEAIAMGVPPVSSLEDALMSTRIITAAYQAARSRQVVSQSNGETLRW